MKFVCFIMLLFFTVAESVIASEPDSAAKQPQSSNELNPRIEKQTVDGETVRVLKTSKPITTVLPAAAIDEVPVLCEIEVSSDYWQANDKVKLEAYIDTPDCAAAYGSCTVSVRTKDEVGEHHTTKYVENWSRETAETQKRIHSYEMNGDTDLVKVRVKIASDGGACVCGLQDGSETDSP